MFVSEKDKAFWIDFELKNCFIYYLLWRFCEMLLKIYLQLKNYCWGAWRETKSIGCTLVSLSLGFKIDGVIIGAGAGASTFIETFF